MDLESIVQSVQSEYENLAAEITTSTLRDEKFVRVWSRELFSQHLAFVNPFQVIITRDEEGNLFQVTLIEICSHCNMIFT